MSKHPDESLKLKVIDAYHAGNSVTSLSSLFGFNRSTIYRWLEEHKKNKWGKGNHSKPETRGRPSKITQPSSKKLVSIIKKPASKFGFETDLWNTKRIQVVCKKELKISVSHMAIWRFLKKINYSCKKVQKQYYEANKSKQKEWVEKTVPQIRRIVRKHKAILYFEDESNIQLSPVMGKSWGPKGKKIVHKVTGQRGSLSAISAISKTGHLVFNIFSGSKRFKSEDIKNFLTQMLNYHKRRHLVVVMDCASCHTSKTVNKFIKSQKRLHVFFLPPRSPEFNPDEQVWAHLKHHSLKSHQETSLKSLEKLSKKKLRKLSKDKKKVKGIFKRCDNHFLYL